MKAQVKLAFENCNGAAMICTRSMQLIVKKTTQTFKTLEGQLVISNHGEKTTISTKCAELDTQIPFYLGVSKSVLEYVIFCHQEDSLWPLSEASNLKKKFDEIFEALKFTRALDNIRNIRKSMVVEIKLLEQNVKHLKQDKEKSDKAAERKQDLEAEIQKYKQHVEDLNVDMEKVSGQMARLFKSNQEFQAVVAKIENLKVQLVSYEEQIERLDSNIEYINDDKEELLQKRDKFHETVKQITQQLHKEGEAKERILAELASIRKRLSQEIVRQGELMGKEKQYLENVEQRKQYSGETETLAKKQEAEKRLDGFLEEKSAEAEKLQLEVSKVSLEIRSCQSKKQFLSDDIKKLRKEIAATEAKIKQELGDVDEATIEYEKSQVESLKRKFQEYHEKKNVEEVENKIEANEKNVGALEAEIENLNQQVSMNSKQSDSYAKLGVLQENIEYKQANIVKLVGKHGKKFEQVFGKPLESDQLEANYEKVHEEQLEKNTAMRKTLEDLNKNLSFNKSGLQHLSDQLQETEKEKQELAARFEELVPSDVAVSEFDDYLKELEEDYKIFLENEKLKQTTKEFNARALEIAGLEKYCVLCRRGFSDAELKKFVKLVNDLSKNINLNNKEFAQLESELKETRKLDVKKLRELQAKQPLLEAEYKEKQGHIEEKELEIESQEENMSEENAKLAEIEKCLNTVQEIQRLRAELEHEKHQLLDLKAELSDYGPTSSTENIHDVLFMKNNEFKSLRQLNNNLHQEKERTIKEYNKLESQIKDKQLSINQLERLMVESESLKRSVADKETKIAELRAQIKEVVVDDLQKELQEKKEQLEAFKIENSQQEKSLRQQKDSATQTWQELESLENKIQRYLGTDERLLDEKNAKVSELQESLSTVEQRLTGINSTIDDIKYQLANQDKLENQIKDNLQLRELRLRYGDVTQEIELLEQQNAEAEKERFEQQSKLLQGQMSTLQSTYGGKLGEIRQMENQVADIVDSLDPEIGEEYHKEWVTLQTKTLVNDDLAKYAKALDSAIMKYHSIKMEEINQVIDELWRATYRGTDVDTIQVKSDVNLQTKGNRSYNYRVVMRKQGAELDMRGRCSAGQKVLTCIIIRLALAECFGINCGMIALDEPTTNLDSENSESLAQSLGRIIDMRRNQRNFQIIVITHDEKFLSHMNAGKYTDHFYRVSRNDRQKSEIEWMNISKISE